jgi:hypothetical protein
MQLDENDIIYNNSGGFSVKSAMMKSGKAPIYTIQTDQEGGTSNNVSDLFGNLAIPNWVLSYENIFDIKNQENDSDEDGGEIDDDLHDKLLNIINQHATNKIKKKQKTKKHRQKKSCTKKHYKK